jgi:hypothetical protein
MSEAVAQFLTERHPEHAGLARWVLAAALEADPDLEPRVYPVWDAIGLRHPDAGYVGGLFFDGPGPRLVFEHGRWMQDEAGLLEGDGKRTRYLRTAAPSEELRAIVQAYVHDAVVTTLARRS